MHTKRYRAIRNYTGETKEIQTVLSLVQKNLQLPRRDLLNQDGESRSLREVGGDFYGVKLWRPGPPEDQGPFAD